MATKKRGEIAIITGDIVGSQRSDPTIWLKYLKSKLNEERKSPAEWEIFRGVRIDLIKSELNF